MPGPPTYAVRVANLSVRNPRPRDDVPALAAGSPHLVSVCEVGGGWVEVVREVEGYRYLGAGPDARHGRREVGLLVRADVVVVDHGVAPMSRAVPRSTVAHDRWAAWARVELPGGVRALAWSTHRNAYVQRRDGRVRPLWRGTRRYRDHARAERALLDAQAAEGWPVLGGGDYNYRVPCGAVRTPAQAWTHAPHRAVADAGRTYLPHGLDGVVLDPAAFTPTGDLDVLPRSRTGSDHDWVTATVRAVPSGR
ncbi:hypothetical protein [Nocardioides litoris]|uniref:hypothetical protein n=1 Tax=Nocardioides litoris TaxID=1926648 RepID=UPI00111F5636|nr:hypothetical protein [Nocardioides litoris]